MKIVERLRLNPLAIVRCYKVLVIFSLDPINITNQKLKVGFFLKEKGTIKCHRQHFKIKNLTNI